MRKDKAMIVHEFRRITIEDDRGGQFADPQGHNPSWSRYYEYPMVLETIEKHYSHGQFVHNTSWGREGAPLHVRFKEKLDDLYQGTTHSDITPSNLSNTFIYDITGVLTPGEERYGFVVNISTLEEIKGADHMAIFNNLFRQVIPGGFLICTFDLPGLQLEKFESLFERKLETNGTPINGLNSRVKNDRYGHLNCGIMVIQRGLEIEEAPEEL